MTTNQPLIEVKNLKLHFPLRVHRTSALRDVFVQSVRHPVQTLTRVPQLLEILTDVNLTISKGERVALIGVNGTGKTSLCRAIAGFYTPTGGSITRSGKIRAIFDTIVGIYPELTGRENAFVLAEFLYPDMKDKEQKINEALEFSELGSFLDTPFKHYSNGMQARLCLSVLTMEPTDLLILDEVFEGADQFFREKISERVLKLIEKSGAVLFVSHNEDQLSRVCNRAIWLHQGKVEFDGEIQEGLRRYRSLAP
jgi:ABC-2 type transport system ATP-binding protein